VGCTKAVPHRPGPKGRLWRSAGMNDIIDIFRSHAHKTHTSRHMHIRHMHGLLFKRSVSFQRDGRAMPVCAVRWVCGDGGMGLLSVFLNGLCYLK
jgi:hypothetical protein